MTPLRSACVLASLLLAACRAQGPVSDPGASGLSRIPRNAARFEIEFVDDSTAVIQLEEAGWVRRGLVAYAVDPQRRDALVARLTVLSRDSTSARLLIASQVTRVTTEHFILLPKPATPWWRSRSVWTSLLSGLAAGALLSR